MHHASVHRWAILVLLLLANCGGEPTIDPDAGTVVPPPPATIGPSTRPARFFAPGAHDGTTELPLVMLLHGYTVNAQLEDIYLSMTRTARAEGFYLILPDGTVDSSGEQYWDLFELAVDDHAYLRELILEAMVLVPVSDVYIIGHSNGGFMAYELACRSADIVTGIASLAGSDVTRACAPARDVSILQIHGTLDETIDYAGGSIAGFDYPGATTVIDTWAARNGCTGSQMGANLDLVADLDGAETTTVEHTGCRAGVALWTMVDGTHIPMVTSEFTPTVMDWLRAH